MPKPKYGSADDPAFRKWRAERASAAAAAARTDPDRLIEALELNAERLRKRHARRLITLAALADKSPE